MSIQNAIKQKPLSALATAAFCAQLAMLLDGGVSVHESLLILRDGTEQDHEAAMFDDLAQMVGSGVSLYQAMSQKSRFSRYTVEMVRIGETTGRLGNVLNALNAYHLRQEHLRQTIKTAVTHPLIMLCLLFALIAVLLVRVLPVFAQVYTQLGADMSPFAMHLLNFGRWLSHGSLYIGAAVIFSALVLFVLWRNDKGKDGLMHFLSRLPLTRPLMHQITTSRFSYAMSLMLKSGISFEQAADMAARLFRGDAKARIQSLLSLLSRDGTLTSALSKSGLFSAMDARLLQVGARVGAMDNAMEDLAMRSEARSDALFERLVGMIEPTLVALMALVAGMVLLSVMLPLLGIMAAI